MSYDLRKNCRNTRPIAELVSLVMDESGEPAMVEGPDVVFVPIENIDGAAKALKRQLHEVVNQGGVAAEEVAILTSDRGLVDNLVGTTIAGLPLVKPPSVDGIRIDTIHRFKGLEADAIFLILPDEARGEEAFSITTSEDWPTWGSVDPAPTCASWPASRSEVPSNLPEPHSVPSAR